MKASLLLQNLYYLLFNEHLFSSLGKIDSNLAKLLVKANYGQRVWQINPIIKELDKRELIFIHIPKCAGTSVGYSLNMGRTRHLSAAIYYLSDKQRFLQSNRFSVIRNPIERLSSFLLHMRSSPFAYQEEKNLFNSLDISENNLKPWLIALITDKKFRRKIFTNTNIGRSGFSVTQSEYLCYKNEILVPNIFTMEKLKTLTDWLSDKLGKEITLPHANSSKRKLNFSDDQELVDLTKKYLKEDYLLYQGVSEMGGAIFDDKKKITQLENLCFGNLL